MIIRPAAALQQRGAAAPREAAAAQAAVIPARAAARCLARGRRWAASPGQEQLGAEVPRALVPRVVVVVARVEVLRHQMAGDVLVVLGLHPAREQVAAEIAVLAEPGLAADRILVREKRVVVEGDLGRRVRLHAPAQVDALQVGRLARARVETNGVGVGLVELAPLRPAAPQRVEGLVVRRARVVAGQVLVAEMDPVGERVADVVGDSAVEAEGLEVGPDDVAPLGGGLCAHRPVGRQLAVEPRAQRVRLALAGRRRERVEAVVDPPQSLGGVVVLVHEEKVDVAVLHEALVARVEDHAGLVLLGLVLGLVVEREGEAVRVVVLVDVHEVERRRDGLGDVGGACGVEVEGARAVQRRAVGNEPAVAEEHVLSPELERQRYAAHAVELEVEVVEHQRARVARVEDVCRNPG